MNILISGGTGFIGKALCQHYLQRGDSVWVWSRSPERAMKAMPGVVAVKSLSDLNEALHFHCVVNLAGAPILGPWWTSKRQQLLLKSREQVTEQLVEYLLKRQLKPELFISASAIGFYGVQGETVLVESSQAEQGFTHDLCRRWEAAAQVMQAHAGRVCIMRLGVVLHKRGGMLQSLLPAFKCALGGRLGDGKQWFSWVHLDDVVRVTTWLEDNPDQHGIFNMVAPEPVRNRDFTRALGKVLQRPTWIPVPAFVLKLLLGQQSILLLGSQRVVPEFLLQAGFSFSKPSLDEALSDI